MMIEWRIVELEEDMPEAKDSKDLEPKAIEKQVLIKRVNPENIKSIYVNDLWVGHTEHEFFLTFSIMEPIQIEKEGDLEELEEIEAIARVKLALSPDFAHRVSKTIATNVERYEERFGKDEDEHKPDTKED